MSRGKETRIPAIEIQQQEIYNKRIFLLILLSKETPAMNTDSFSMPPPSLPQDTLLLLAREQEWAEAYAVDHPHCDLGHVYLRFLHDEIARLMAAV